MQRRWLLIPFFLALVLVTGIVTLRQTRIYDATISRIMDNMPSRELRSL